MGMVFFFHCFFGKVAEPDIGGSIALLVPDRRRCLLIAITFRQVTANLLLQVRL
jgi:hypothetical protein